MKTVAEYRKFAEDSRELAAKLKTPDDKRAVQLMAAAWDKVANEREGFTQRAAEILDHPTALERYGTQGSDKVIEHPEPNTNRDKE